MFRTLLAVVFGFLALGGNSLAQETRTYTATGSAIMGTGMTMDETRRLALDAARRQALQRFGAYVRSEETVGDSGISQETRVSNAAVVSVENKKVNRAVKEETIRFTVTADFEIEVGSFNQNEPADSGYRIESSGEEVNRESAKRYDSVSGSSKSVSGASFEVRKSKAEMKEAFRRHVAFIRQNAKPNQVTDVKLMGKPTIGTQRTMKATFRFEPGFRSITDTLQALRSEWEGVEPPINMKRSFAVAFIGTSVGGEVTFVKAATRLFDLDYTSGVLFHGPETYDFEVAISPSTLRKTNRVNAVITRFLSTGDLRTYLRKNGFEVTEVKPYKLRSYVGGSIQRQELTQ